jgi:hypothetical protein
MRLYGTGTVPTVYLDRCTEDKHYFIPVKDKITFVKQHQNDTFAIALVNIDIRCSFIIGDP